MIPSHIPFRYGIAVVASLVFALLLAAQAHARKPVHLSLWVCVHRQERTAWNDPNAPYWGGYQLSEWFISNYEKLGVPHPPGTPDQWTPLAQTLFVEGAYEKEHYSRSWLWTQWPPSRGVCF